MTPPAAPLPELPAPELPDPDPLVPLPSTAPVPGSTGILIAAGATMLPALPDPAEPPELISTGVPEMVTPAGPTTMKPPPRPST